MAIDLPDSGDEMVTEIETGRGDHGKIETTAVHIDAGKMMTGIVDCGMMTTASTMIARGDGEMHTMTEIGIEGIEMIGSTHGVQGQDRPGSETIVGGIRGRGK